MIEFVVISGVTMFAMWLFLCWVLRDQPEPSGREWQRAQRGRTVKQNVTVRSERNYLD